MGKLEGETGGGGRWLVDVHSTQLSVLALSAVNLPGGQQRLRSLEDRLHMRDYLSEADLICVSQSTSCVLDQFYYIPECTCSTKCSISSINMNPKQPSYQFVFFPRTCKRRRQRCKLCTTTARSRCTRVRRATGVCRAACSCACRTHWCAARRRTATRCPAAPLLFSGKMGTSIIYEHYC